MNLIVAVSFDWCIGKDNELLQPIHADLKRFKEFTTDNIILCGRTTYETFPKRPLPHRKNIILTNNNDYKADGADVIHDISELSNYDLNKIWLCGGASLYGQLLDYCEKAYITVIHTNKQGNKYFPNLNLFLNWVPVSSSEIFEENGIEYQYLEYINKDVKDIKNYIKYI